VCLKYGHVGCCDDSPNQHATKHVEDSGHRGPSLTATLEESRGRVLRAKTQQALALTLEDLPPDKPVSRLLLKRGAWRAGTVWRQRAGGLRGHLRHPRPQLDERDVRARPRARHHPPEEGDSVTIGLFAVRLAWRPDQARAKPS
jgi:hypothetical protein